MKLTSIYIYLIVFISPLLLGKAAFANTSESLMPVTVQINWHHQFQFAGFYAAIAKGYYRDAGLDVTIKPWQPGINIREEVVSGRATFGTSYSSVIADFIKGHPIKAVMTSFQYSPMVLLSQEPITELSQLSGKSVSHYNNLQILALLNRAEPEVEEPTQTYPPTGNLEDFIQGRVDLYGAYETNEPFQLNELEERYFLVKPGDFGISSAEDLVIVSQEFATENPEIVDQFRQATIAGWQYAISHQAEIVDYILANYPVIKSRQALLFEARATTKYVRTGEIPIGSLNPARLMATAAESRDVGLITAKELQRFNPEDLIASRPDANALTQAEKLYLIQNPIIRIGNDINWAPFEFVDQQGEFKGIVADYFKLFEERLGVTFQPVVDTKWSDVVSMMQSRELDMLTAVTPTPERKTYLNFTTSYLSFPMVLVGNQSTLFINDYSELAGKRVAVVRDYWSHEYLRNNHPEVELVLVDDVTEGLKAVINGQALVYSGNLAVINYTQQNLGITGLQVVGQSNQRFELAVAVHKDNPLLLSIMQKTLNNLTPEEKGQIYTNWISLEMLTRLDRRQIFYITLIVSALLFLMLVWVLIYRFQKKRLQKYIYQVNDLSYASAIDPKTYNTLWVSKRYRELTGYSEKELKRMSFTDAANPEKMPRDIQSILTQVVSGLSWTGEVEGKTKHGFVYWVELTLSPQKSLFGDIHQILVTRVNITDKKRIEELSIKDELTKLHNRRYLTQIFPAEIRRIQRKNHHIALALFDLDHFKLINDNYGHEFGDDILRRVADLAIQYFNRGDDFVFRLGGEEFLIITNDTTTENFEAHLQDFCVGLLALKIENQGTEHGFLTLSIGAGVWPAAEVSNFTDVYATLDKALYQAKHQGRNQVVMVEHR